MQRPDFFKDASLEQWQSWVWQQQNAVRTTGRLESFLAATVKDRKKVSKILDLAEKWVQKGLRFQVTPYVLALINWKEDVIFDPIWRQVLPFTARSGTGPDEYRKENENWEEKKEMISPIAQHKYDNRAIVYLSDCCLGYCNYCFRSLVSTESAEKHGGNLHWRKTMEAIRKRPDVEEVILSGGDPLVYDNAMIGGMLKDLRSINHVRSIRIHTRAWTHNPFRIDDEFCGLLKKFEVTVLGVHTIHPKEITAEFKDAAARVRASGAKTLLLADIPLVKGVNDDAAVLRELFMALYLQGVKPYYLSHNMPNIPFASAQRTSVRKGVELLGRLKRRVSNPAVPEYIITDRSGKKTVPECEVGSVDFVYGKRKDGWPVVRFKNWKGERVEYMDAKDK